MCFFVPLVLLVIVVLLRLSIILFCCYTLTLCWESLVTVVGVGTALSCCCCCCSVYVCAIVVIIAFLVAVRWGFWPKWMFWEARITSAVSCSWPDDEGACSPVHKLSKHFFNQITTKTTFEYHFWYSYPSLIIQCNITVITICCHASKCLPPLATDQLIDLIVIVIAIVIVIVIIIVIINH